MLDDGVMHEHDVVNRLRSKGIKVLHSYSDGQMEVVCNEDPRIVGHPDGILDGVPADFGLDFVDEYFKSSHRRFYCLEVTGCSHFNFLRLERDHSRSVLHRKFVQMQLYLNSEEVRSYTDSMVLIAKNKNTSSLYEEGVGRDTSIVRETVEKLKRVQDFVASGKVLPYRCVDWRKQYCRYRHLCFGPVVPEVPLDGQILRGESLKEAEELLQAADLWLKGKDLVLQGDELIEEARALFRETVEDYGVSGLTVAHAKALMVEASRRKIDMDALQLKYPSVYNDIVSIEQSRYIRVTKI